MLQQLHTWMRANGVIHARFGEYELTLGPPVPPQSTGDEPVETEDDEERRALAELGFDADAILTLKVGRST